MTFVPWMGRSQQAFSLHPCSDHVNGNIEHVIICNNIGKVTPQG